MKFLRYVFRAGVQRIFNARLGVFTIIMLLASWSYNRPLRNFSVEMKYPCSVWVYPFMLAQYAFLVLFFFAVIYANADIPFMQYSNMYSLIRAGRKKWGAAQMLILLFRSVILTGVSCLCSIVTLLPHIELTADWGKLIKTVAMGMMQGSYNLKYSFFYEVMIKLSPLELMALSVGITVGVIFFLSLGMFLVSLYSSRTAAVSGAALYVLLLFFVLNTHPKIRNSLAKLVPTAWLQIARIYTPDMGYYWLPPVCYMFVSLGVGIVIVSLLILTRIKYAEFNWNNEDL